MTLIVMNVDEAIEAIENGDLSFIDLKAQNPTLYKDKLVAIAALEKDPSNVEILDPSLYDEQEVMFYAVKKKGKNLKFASENLKNDPFIVSTAVLNDGLALIFASDELKATEKIALDAFKQNDFSYAYFHESLLQKDKFYAELGKHAGLHFLTIVDDATVLNTPRFLTLLDSLINNGNFMPTTDSEIEEALTIVVSNKEIKDLLDSNPDLVLVDIVELLKSKHADKMGDDNHSPKGLSH